MQLNLKHNLHKECTPVRASILTGCTVENHKILTNEHNDLPGWLKKNNSKHFDGAKARKLN